MTTTRFLFILFALLNVLFFAATHGWLGFGPSVESGKIAIELNPERINILGHTPPPETAQTGDTFPSVAPANTTTATEPSVACLAWSGLSPVQNNKLISLFSTANIQTTTRDVQVASTWRVVRTPPLGTNEAAEILADNMVELGVEKNSIQIEETGDNKFLIVLGEPFRNRKGAERHLETMNAKGINASIEPRNTTERRIEATVSKEKAEAVLSGQSFAKRHKPCSP
ncbi:MAG: hypothetical protein LBP99_03135 [Azoarcus sp.]|jgi:hypothetical protein|nr:hypothetical protein [Azoarcus sp.]